MPITFNIDRSKSLTTFTLSGEVTFQEFTQILNSYGKQGATVQELYDARSLEGKRLSSEEMNMLAKYLAKYSDKRTSGSKTAIVVSETIDFGLSRMISLLTEYTTAYEIEVFRNMAEAHQWLEES
jgi:hypothetical protein